VSMHDRYALRPFSVSGSGDAEVAKDIHVRALSGLDVRVQSTVCRAIKSFVCRQVAAGTATGVRIIALQKGKTFGPSGDYTTFDSIPEEDQVFRIDDGAGGPVTPTASAVTAFVSGPISSQPVWRDSLRLVFDVTAPGAWEFVGNIEDER
jgi:hypothetical protein